MVEKKEESLFQLTGNEASNESEAVRTDAFFGCQEPALVEILPMIPEETKKIFSEVYLRFCNLADSDSDVHAVERALESYFSAMVDFLEKAEEERGLFPDKSKGYVSVVEALYLMLCVRDRRSNSYYIPKRHPIRILNHCLDEIFETLLEENACKSISDDGTEQAEDNTSTIFKEVAQDVLRSVFNTKERNRQQIRLYCENQVYETSTEQQEAGWMKAEPFRQKKGNTRIPYYRIWEKLISYKERHKISQGVIKVGVFGELTGDSNEVDGLLGKNVTVKWIKFENMPIMGEYYFQDESGQLYDLSNIQDVWELIEEYQILLFLDMNCFYRQWQRDKTVEECNEGVHCRWYLDRSREQKSFRDTAAYYKNIFLHVGLWLNSLRESNSSSFEFDAKLFQNLADAADANTDIYLYIRGGNKIASYNLEYSGECNDEYYDGKSLLVYLISKTNNDNFNQNYQTFLQQGKEDEQKESEERKEEIKKEKRDYVKIRLWKILKSIDNDYCKNILEKYGNDIIGQQELIRALHMSYLILCYKVDAKAKKIEIGYDLSFDEFFDRNVCSMKNYMEALVKSVLEYALKTENMYCIKKYFKELLVNSTITNAGSIRDLVFAHIWSQPWLETSYKRMNINEQMESAKKNSIEGKHKLHKTIYVTIERLENLRMRPLTDMRGYFINVFREAVCPEVAADCFEETLHDIAECCKSFQHTSSSLYLNSTLINR